MKIGRAKAFVNCVICNCFKFIEFNKINTIEDNGICKECFDELTEQYNQLEIKNCAVEEYIDSIILINNLSRK